MKRHAVPVLTTVAVLVALATMVPAGAELVLAGSGARQEPGSGQRGATVAPTNAQPRPEGNFVSVCRYSHTNSDDPIVRPNAPGAAHSHDFFANTSTDAASTLESLQAAPTRCPNRPGDTAAYWVPTLSDNNRVVEPRLVRAYYLVGGRDPASIRPFPSGLKIVAGAGGSVPSPVRAVQWACIGATGQTPPQSTAPDCAAGTHLVMRIHFPDCWDGQNLDSADHRSHMTYSQRRMCPASHPVAVPRLRIGINYPEGVGGADVTLSSGGQETAHADFFNAWNQPALERLVRECLNAAVDCGARGPNGGDR